MNGNQKHDSKEFPFQLLYSSYADAKGCCQKIYRENYESCTIEYILDGGGFLDINGFSCAPAEGSIYILHKHSQHKYWADYKKPWKKLFFVVDGDFMEYLFNIYNLSEIYHIPDCPQLLKYFKDMYYMAHHADATTNRRASVVFHQMLEEIYSLVYGLEFNVPDDVAALKKYLDSHIEERVCLEAYCRKYGRSSAHMIRQFKEYISLSPYDYLMQKRIDAARLMLLHTHLRIKEIAAQLQFSDQYYFSNYFKKRVGMSPKQFRINSLKPTSVTSSVS